jgi:hypothetical protein
MLFLIIIRFYLAIVDHLYRSGEEVQALVMIILLQVLQLARGQR